MKGLIRGIIFFYRLFISPILSWLSGPGGGCRFEPTCSQYFLQAVEMHGSLRGSVLGVRRICRCHPWGGSGFDPVPKPCSTEHSLEQTRTGLVRLPQEPAFGTKEKI